MKGKERMERKERLNQGFVSVGGPFAPTPQGSSRVGNRKTCGSADSALPFVGLHRGCNPLSIRFPFPTIRISFFILVYLWLSGFLLANAYEFDQHSSTFRGSFTFSGFAASIGTRAMGMNGAFVAVSDDSTAPFWNTSGLAVVGYKELFTMYTDLYGLGLIRTNAVGISFPDIGSGATAVNWVQLRYDLESWREQAFIGSYAKRLTSFSACGLNVKHLRQSSNIVTAEGDATNAKGWSLDAGLIVRLGKRGRFGITVQDAYSIINLSSGEKDRMPINYRAGFAYYPFSRLVGAFDVIGEEHIPIKSVHVGGEYWIAKIDLITPIDEKNLAIRGGVAKEFIGKERLTYAAGLSIRVSSWQFDYAYLADNDGLGDTHRFSTSVRF